MQLTSKLPEMLIRNSLVLALICGCASVQATSMYKWVDENGTVHYEQQPPRGQKAENISRTYQSSSQPKPEQPQTEEKKEGDAPNSPNESTEPTEPTEPARSDEAGKFEDKVAQVNKKNCETAKANLETYKMRPKRIKQPDGTVIDMTDEILDQKIMQAERDTKTYCK